jgi:uncharacterized membrane protein
MGKSGGLRRRVVRQKGCSMPETKQRARRRHRSRVLATIRALIRTRITAGLFTILPIIITVWMVRLLFYWLRDASLWIVDLFLLSSWGRDVIEKWGVTPEQLTAEGLAALPVPMQWAISIFCVLSTFMLLYLIGLFTANMIGRRALEMVDQVAARVPFVKLVYGTLKQILGLFSTNQSKGFQRVALVPFPNELTRSVGFVTNTMTDSETGEELCAVFIATTPNPTTGFVFVLRRSDIIEVDWSVEDAVKLIMSGGILSPPYVTMLTGGRGVSPPLAVPGGGPAPS